MGVAPEATSDGPPATAPGLTTARSPFGRCVTMPHYHGPVSGLHQQRLRRQKQRSYSIAFQACDVLRTSREMHTGAAERR